MDFSLNLPSEDMKTHQDILLTDHKVSKITEERLSVLMMALNIIAEVGVCRSSLEIPHNYKILAGQVYNSLKYQ